MPVHSLQTLRALALAGLVLGSTSLVLGQEGSSAGIVRISSGSMSSGASTGAVYSTGYSGGYTSGGYCDSCPSNEAVFHNRMHGWGHHSACSACQNGACQVHHQKHPMLANLFAPHTGHYSADHGWSVPARNPIQRAGVNYSRYWPDAWPGEGQNFVAQYPMVYMPTDTTQLGFYYQHVPYWRPDPSKIPPAPLPYNWHVLNVRQQYWGHGHHYRYNDGSIAYGEAGYGDLAIGPVTYGTSVSAGVESSSSSPGALSPIPSDEPPAPTERSYEPEIRDAAPPPAPVPEALLESDVPLVFPVSH